MFGVVSFLLGLIRLLCGLVLLSKERTVRELYMLTLASFVVEIVRDFHLHKAQVLGDFNGSWAIAPSAFMTGWLVAVFKHYTLK
jgi:hypothetical protein